METIATDNAPKALGPYAQAVKSGSLVWCSGQVPVDPATGAIEAKGAAEQAMRAIANLAAVLDAAGSSLAKVVKTTVYLKDLADFAAVNEVYAALFGAARPARSCVQVAALPKGALIEIDAVAEA